jgi:hypothetical protein
MLHGCSRGSAFGQRGTKGREPLQEGRKSMNGLWIAHFNAGPAHGNGLAVFRAGEILGGDYAHTWVGTYEEEGRNLYARVRVAPYISASNGELVVPERSVTMTLQGTRTEMEAELSGHADDSEVTVSIEMHRAA